MTIDHFPNPRVELEEHYYNAVNTKLRDLGLKPHHLGEELVRSMLSTIERHKDRVIARAIAPEDALEAGRARRRRRRSPTRSIPRPRRGPEPRSAVLFDLDGVLVDSRRPIAGSMNRALAARGLPRAPARASCTR